MRPPRPPRAPTSLLNAARRPLARLRRTNTHISNMAHHISLEPEPFPLRCNTVFFFPLSLSSIFSIRRRVSVMKGSVLIQDEEIMRWPSEDYKTMLLLMS